MKHFRVICISHRNVDHVCFSFGFEKAAAMFLLMFPILAETGAFKAFFFKNSAATFFAQSSNRRLTCSNQLAVINLFILSSRILVYQMKMFFIMILISR